MKRTFVSPCVFPRLRRFSYPLEKLESSRSIGGYGGDRARVWVL